MDYQMQMVAKLDYLFHQPSRLLQASEIQLLKNWCEQERTQFLTTLMLLLENFRVAGYMPTGNRSLFLQTDGSLAGLYHCPIVPPQLHTRNQCCERIPILYHFQIQLVDLIRRQTHPTVNIQKCYIPNLKSPPLRHRPRKFVVYTNTWHRAPSQSGQFWVKKFFTGRSALFSLIPSCTNVHWKRTQQFLGQYLFQCSIWKCSGKIFGEAHRIFELQTGPGQFPLFCPRTYFFVDMEISPGDFKDQFMDTFVPRENVLEHCRVFFSVFLILKQI